MVLDEVKSPGQFIKKKKNWVRDSDLIGLGQARHLYFLKAPFPCTQHPENVQPRLRTTG